MKPENVLLKQQGRSGIKVGQNPFHFAIIENNFSRNVHKFIIESCIQLDNHSSAHFDNLMKHTYGLATSPILQAEFLYF